ncbi:MAG TPA: hypothetical protein VGA00_11750, partial [Acidiferrobacterales bacterium]
DAILHLTEEDMYEVFCRVYAIRDHALRVPNEVVNLPGGRKYTAEEKIAALTKYIYPQRTAAGTSALQTLDYVLYGGTNDSIAERLWNAVELPRWKIGHLGVNAVGELVGWAMPYASGKGRGEGG